MDSPQRESADDLVRVNQALHRLKQSYRDLYHSAPVMYFSLDAGGHFVSFNDMLLRTLGYQRAELSGKHYTVLLAPACRQSFLRDSDALQQPREWETQWLTRDGKVLDVWVRSVPVRDSHGRLVRSRSDAQDVTERNRLANELRRQRDDLERANARLRAINSELDTFTYRVSHDLKEPLKTLQAYTMLLFDEIGQQLGADGFEHVNRLMKVSQRMADMIRDLLNLSSIGRVLHEPRVFNLAETVATVRRDLGDLLLRKEADLQAERSLPDVYGDADRVAQLLVNLVANGLKYNRSATPTVVIGQVRSAEGANGVPAAALAPGGTDFVTLFVRDNGIGIQPRYHAEIFDIFRRLHEREEFEGTGAGLTICKKIVEGHGGRIWVESQAGQGATFYFTLPAAGKGEHAPNRPAAYLPVSHAGATAAQARALPHSGSDAGGPAVDSGPATAPEAPGVRARPPRLLLVEDMPEIGWIVESLAKRAGHSLLWLTTAEKAWDYLQVHRPDLLLLDINLPGMNGIELCQRLRAVARLRDLPIALFSQGERPALDADALAAGATHVVSKDLLAQPERWQRRIDEILGP
jgi:PAS domain S-box-containing protein